MASDLDVIPFFYDSMPNHEESGIKIATKENIYINETKNVNVQIT